VSTEKAKQVVEALVGTAYELDVRLRHYETDDLFWVKLYALVSLNADRGTPEEPAEPYRVTLFDRHMKPLNHWEVPASDLPPWPKARWGEFCTAGIPDDYDFASVEVTATAPNR